MDFFVVVGLNVCLIVFCISLVIIMISVVVWLELSILRLLIWFIWIGLFIDVILFMIGRIWLMILLRFICLFIDIDNVLWIKVIDDIWCIDLISVFCFLVLDVWWVCSCNSVVIVCRLFLIWWWIFWIVVFLDIRVWLCCFILVMLWINIVVLILWLVIISGRVCSSIVVLLVLIFICIFFLFLVSKFCICLFILCVLNGFEISGCVVLMRLMFFNLVVKFIWW